MRDFLLNINKDSLVNVVIYGAGQAGAQLASLKFNGKHNINFFLMIIKNYGVELYMGLKFTLLII